MNAKLAMKKNSILCLTASSRALRHRIRFLFTTAEMNSEIFN